MEKEMETFYRNKFDHKYRHQLLDCGLTPRQVDQEVLPVFMSWSEGGSLSDRSDENIDWLISSLRPPRAIEPERALAFLHKGTTEEARYIFRALNSGLPDDAVSLFLGGGRFSWEELDLIATGLFGKDLHLQFERRDEFAYQRYKGMETPDEAKSSFRYFSRYRPGVKVEPLSAKDVATYAVPGKSYKEMSLSLARLIPWEDERARTILSKDWDVDRGYLVADGFLQGLSAAEVSVYARESYSLDQMRYMRNGVFSIPSALGIAEVDLERLFLRVRSILSRDHDLPLKEYRAARNDIVENCANHLRVFLEDLVDLERSAPKRESLSKRSSRLQDIQSKKEEYRMSGLER